MTVFYVFETQKLPGLSATAPLPDDEHIWPDLSHVRELGLRLCLGMEWHRFPGHYLVLEGVKVDFIKSEFDGLLPGHFRPSSNKGT